jgi:cytidine deaminase
LRNRWGKPETSDTPNVATYNAGSVLVELARSKADLIRAAARARLGAVAPYSRFKVGAALLTRSGEVLIGANVESASYGLTCCAERVALFHALTSGKKDFVAIAIVARAPGGPMPCGACRQLLAEYAPKAKVWIADSRRLERVKEFAVHQLLPGAFLQVPR